MKDVSIAKVIECAKLLRNPTRVRILFALHQDRELCVSALGKAANASQSSTSHQIAFLEEHGVVKAYRKGKQVCYQLTKTPKTKHMLDALFIINPR